MLSACTSEAKGLPNVGHVYVSNLRTHCSVVFVVFLGDEGRLKRIGDLMSRCWGTYSARVCRKNGIGYTEFCRKK